MLSIVTAKSVKSLVKALRADVVPEMKHTQVLEIVAEALGWKADALMHRLKTLPPGNMVSLDENNPLVQDFNPVVLAASLGRRGREFDSYRMAKMFRAKAPGEKLLKAIALFMYEPNLARALAQQAFVSDPILLLSCLVWSDDSSLEKFSFSLVDRVARGGNREYLLKAFEKHISNCEDADSFRLMVAWCSSKEKVRLVWSVYPRLELPFQIDLTPVSELEEVMDDAPVLNGYAASRGDRMIQEMEGVDHE